MALPSSGEISLHDIAGEFGGTTPYALRDYLGAAPAFPRLVTAIFFMPPLGG